MLAAAVAPAFVKTAGLLMPIKPLVMLGTIEVPMATLPAGWDVVKTGMVYVATFSAEVDLQDMVKIS
jgi:hypothetical protein